MVPSVLSLKLVAGGARGSLLYDCFVLKLTNADFGVTDVRKLVNCSIILQNTLMRDFN